MKYQNDNGITPLVSRVSVFGRTGLVQLSFWEHDCVCSIRRQRNLPFLFTSPTLMSLDMGPDSRGGGVRGKQSTFGIRAHGFACWTWMTYHLAAWWADATLVDAGDGIGIHWYPHTMLLFPAVVNFLVLTLCATLLVLMLSLGLAVNFPRCGCLGLGWLLWCGGAWSNLTPQ